MSMSKQDFIALADAIKTHNANAETDDEFNRRQIDALAEFCAQQNPMFKRERWLSYIKGECGSSGGKVKTRLVPGVSPRLPRVKQEPKQAAYEYEVQGLYSGSWECVTTEDTRAEALKRETEYRENERHTAFRVVRVKAVKHV